MVIVDCISTDDDFKDYPGPKPISFLEGSSQTECAPPTLQAGPTLILTNQIQLKSQHR